MTGEFANASGIVATLTLDNDLGSLAFSHGEITLQIVVKSESAGTITYAGNTGRIAPSTAELQPLDSQAEAILSATRSEMPLLKTLIAEMRSSQGEVEAASSCGIGIFPTVSWGPAFYCSCPQVDWEAQVVCQESGRQLACDTCSCSCPYWLYCITTAAYVCR
jgi:hypothetical protein